MKLLYSPTSPYARKVRIVAAEKGLTLDLAPASPFEAGSGVAEANPIGKIPALVLDDGSTLFDSSVICEYFDAIGSGPVLIPPAGAARWAVLRLHALGDGITDAAFNHAMELRRPESERSPSWQDRWAANIVRSAAAAPVPAAGAWTLGEITLVCALGYTDFRLPHIDWRSGAPGLAAWYAVQAQRPVAVETAPA